MKNQPMDERVRLALLSLLTGGVTITVIYLLLENFGGERGHMANIILFDAEDAFKLFPFTIQNIMWLVFAFGCGELTLRHHASNKEREQVNLGYLPEDDATLLRPRDMPNLYRNLLTKITDPERFLPQIIQRVVLQYQSSRDIGQAHSVLTTTLELHSHEIDLRYTMIRYVSWLIPTLGFIGTVVGIALALNYAGEADFKDPTLLSQVTKRLAVAFNTTLVALLQAAILVFITHIVQAREELALNHAGQYCLDNLVNRFFVKPEGE